MVRRENLDNVAGLILAGVLWMTSMYQLEVIYIWINEGRTVFEMPFYLWTMSLPVARDFWYVVNALAFALVSISALTYGGRRARRRASRLVEEESDG